MPDSWRGNAKRVALAVPVVAGVAVVSWAMGAVLMTAVALGSWKYARRHDR
jgi:hypothetical protein